MKLFEERNKEWMSNISQEVRDLVNREEPITLAEWEGLRLNSWEQEELYPHLSDEAFLHVFKNVAKNCTQKYCKRPCVTYDDAMSNLFIPEMIKRFESVAKRDSREPSEAEKINNFLEVNDFSKTAYRELEKIQEVFVLSEESDCRLNKIIDYINSNDHLVGKLRDQKRLLAMVFPDKIKFAGKSEMYEGYCKIYLDHYDTLNEKQEVNNYTSLIDMAKDVLLLPSEVSECLLAENCQKLLNKKLPTLRSEHSYIELAEILEKFIELSKLGEVSLRPKDKERFFSRDGWKNILI